MVHRVLELYKKYYLILPQIPKKDRYGICLRIDNIFIETLTNLLKACFEIKEKKKQILAEARIQIEVLKRLIRLIYELKILRYKKYIEFSINLQEISKMINGWIKYLN